MPMKNDKIGGCQNFEAPESSKTKFAWVIMSAMSSHMPKFKAIVPSQIGVVFGRPFVKRFALCYRTVVLSVCDVGALWPNGCTDIDES